MIGKGAEIVHYMVIGVLSALVVPVGGVAALVGAGWLVRRWQLRRSLLPGGST